MKAILVLAALLIIPTFAPNYARADAADDDDPWIAEIPPTKGVEMEYRMAPFTRWQIVYVAKEDDAKIKCYARAERGHGLDRDEKGGRDCILQGVTGKTTLVVTALVVNAGKKPTKIRSFHEGDI